MVQFLGHLNRIGGTAGNAVRLKFRSKGQFVPDEVSYKGRSLHVTGDSSNPTEFVISGIRQGGPFQYLVPRKGLWFVTAAEFKDLGKKPEKHQAEKILGLLNKMPVEVISDIKTFKAWFDKVAA